MTKEIELHLAKGFRDFAPAEKILRDEVIKKIKEVFEIYGFSPLETPTVERLDVLTAKFAAGDNSDVIGELYKFKDQGGRELGLRYEFTFALARFMGMNQQIRLPFKRYQIGTVFRDGPIKAGRYREFYQCDVDTVGVRSVVADAEIISLLSLLFKKLEIEVDIEVNSRKLLNDAMEFVGIKELMRNKVLVIADKLKKIGPEKVEEELSRIGIEKQKIKQMMGIFYQKGSNSEILENLKSIIGYTEGIKELEELFKYLDLFGINYKFLPSLVRGLGYYTGPIFEVFSKDNDVVSSSLAGGGRWDKMIGRYIGKEDSSYPATGVGIGLEPIMELVKARKGLAKQTVVDLYIIPIDTEKESIKITQELRKEGVRVSMDLMKRSISKNLEYANKLSIPFVVLVGEEEIKQKKIKVKNMKTGEQVLISLEEVKAFISSRVSGR